VSGTTIVKEREPVPTKETAQAKACAAKRLQSTRNALLTKPKTQWAQTDATVAANASETDTAQQVDGALVMVAPAQRLSKRRANTATSAKSTKPKTQQDQTDATMLLNALEREPAPALDGAQVNLTAELNINITCSY
jgi:hypothetical protein